VQRAPGIPHALKGREINANLGRMARRGRERVFGEYECAVIFVKRSDDSRQAPSFRDGPKDQTSDAQLRIWESRDSGFDAEPVIGPRFARTRSHRRGMTVMDCTRSLFAPTRWLAMTALAL
jgi:hypothetical protein